MKGVAIDRERAIRLAAACGLALIAVTILPGLLRPPEAPPLPADVGFRRSEAVPAVLPRQSPPGGEAGRARVPQRGDGGDRRRSGRAGRGREADTPPRADRRPAGSHASAPGPRPPRRGPAAGSGRSPVPPPAPAEAPAPAGPPAPVTTPAATPVTPAPTPAPQPASEAGTASGPGRPGDGSQEFAPR